MTGGEDRRIRALRPGKRPPDPWRPVGVAVEKERTPAGQVVDAVTVFLAGSECPFTCAFCDLWRETLDGPTPIGALPRQLDLALAEVGPLAPAALVKLYNASNFFDRRAVPRADWPDIARRLVPFDRVTVECHPRLVGSPARELSDLLEGRLEVAMGLETVHGESLRRLNKGMRVEDFDRAAGELRRLGLGVRAFVLLGAPFVPPREMVDWTVRSVAHAINAGAEVVSIIPLRGGNGELDRLGLAGSFRPPSLSDLESALDRSLELPGGVVLADLWDLERLATCDLCAARRRARLERINLTGAPEKRIACGCCAGPG